MGRKRAAHVRVPFSSGGAFYPPNADSQCCQLSEPGAQTQKFIFCPVEGMKYFSYLFLIGRLVVPGVHLVLQPCAEVKLALLDLTPCRAQHWLRQTHRFQERNGCSSRNRLVRREEANWLFLSFFFPGGGGGGSDALYAGIRRNRAHVCACEGATGQIFEIPCWGTYYRSIRDPVASCPTTAPKP